MGCKLDKARQQLLPPLATCKIAVIGLGYVGLPLAVEFAKSQDCLRTGISLIRHVIGYDINQERLRELSAGHDRNKETSSQELAAATNLTFTEDSNELASADVFIITVPTPIDSAKRPNLTSLKSASDLVGCALRLRAAVGTKSLPVVIFESTVYPGATEEVCVPILEQASGLKFNESFFCGYSPERINPGDSEHKLTTITKVTSGSTPETTDWVDCLYGSIIKAGTHVASSLKVAEAAKVIENTQRDLNIALVNELAMIFRKIGIDTIEVLEAAGSKWNFLPFRPGLVGGHCISVDPYYLTYKAEELGYYPQVVLAGRRINDGMGSWLVEQLVLEMARRGMVIAGSKVLVLGLSFKENCPDLRNSRVVDIVKVLQSYGFDSHITDPWVDPQEAKQLYGLEVSLDMPTNTKFNAVVLAVAHHQFAALSATEWRRLLAPDGLIFDIKSILPRELQALRL